METLSSSKKGSWLSWFLRGVLILALLILFARLFELSVIKGRYFRTLSEENRIKRIPLAAPRGKIFARGGEILVTNSGEGKRVYPLADKFAHVSGYLGEATSVEVGKIDPKCSEKGPRKLGELVGRGGLEEEYNCRLSGVDGEELVEVDTKGVKIRTLGRKEPQAGANLKTAIDYGLQKKVAEAMTGKAGAVVITDETGDVLALYSAPSFDPNLFLAEGKDVEIKSLLADRNLPLFNRAIGGTYHPGSVFKILVAIAALEEGKIDENYTFIDPGVITIGKFSYSNWYFNQYGKVEGEINLVRAIARSTDTFFYKIGELTGIDKLTEWAGKFGLGGTTGIDLPGEVAGLIPTPEWKLKVRGEPWFLGNTYHFSIGQGDLALTPLSLNTMVRTIATAELCPVQIARGGRTLECKKLMAKKESLDLVREGMRQACSPGGTGFTFFDWDSRPSADRSGPVACKTGTAETNEDGKTHAWFTVFGPLGPADKGSKIIATVIVEGGGEGSKVAGPIAREIFDYYYFDN